MKVTEVDTDGVKGKLFTWSRKDVRQKMNEIAKAEKCSLVFLTKKDGFGGCNYGSSAGKTIMLAPFIKVNAGEHVDGYDYPNGCDNPVECQFITFFHELAHVKLSKKVPSSIRPYAWNDTSRYQYEMWITMLDIEHAHKKYGIKFSDNAVGWMMEEAKSYAKDDVKADVGYGLVLKKSNRSGYSVLSQWEFKG